MAKRKVHINSLRNLVQYRNLIPDPQQLDVDITSSLADIGEKIIKMAYATKTFKDRTYNLRDSYVSAVFKNGNVVPGTVRYVGEAKSTIAIEHGDLASGDTEMATGREEANRFIGKWGFSAGRPGGIVLVVAATMFYSGIVEAHKYHVISHINNELEALSRNGFTTIKYKAHIDGSYVKEPSILREGLSTRMQVINV